MRGVNRQEQLEVNFASGKFVGELSEEPLECTACRIVSNLQRVAQSFEDSAALFARCVGVWRKSLNGVDSVGILVVGTSEESDCAVDKEARFSSGVQSCGRENRVGEVVDENVIGIVSFCAVDDDGLKVFVPALRFAEEFAKFTFAFDWIVSKAVDEIAGNVVENVWFVGVAAVIVDGSPKIFAGKFDKFVHGEDLRKQKSPQARGLRARNFLSDGLLRALAVEAKKSAELIFGVIGDALGDVCAAVMASQSRRIFISDGSGLLRDFVGVQVGFGIVAGGDCETVEISVFDSHSLRFCNGFVARVLSGAEPFNRESFARIRVDKRDDNFNGDEIFNVAFRGRNLLRAQDVGRDDGSKPVFCKRGINFFKHVSGSGVFVAVKVVGAVFGDMTAVFHDFNKFFGDVLHEGITYRSSMKRMFALLKSLGGWSRKARSCQAHEPIYS